MTNYEALHRASYVLGFNDGGRDMAGMVYNFNPTCNSLSEAEQLAQIAGQIQESQSLDDRKYVMSAYWAGVQDGADIEYRHLPTGLK